RGADRRQLPGARADEPEGARRGHHLVRRPGCAGRRGPGGPAQPGGRVPRPHRAGAAVMTSVAPATADGRFPPGTFAPDPGRGRLGRMLLAQSGVEARLALRNGEQVLLTLLIPLALLAGLSLLDVVPLPAPRVAMVTPGVLALAVLSTAFTGQAI